MEFNKENFDIRRYFKNLPKRLLVPDEQKRIIQCYAFTVLGVISLFMTIVNILTDEKVLGVATGIFALCSFINLAIILALKNLRSLASALMYIEVILLFSFFIVEGYPSGFSIIWVCLIPPMALLIFNRKPSIILCLLMLVELIFFLWVPFGRSLLGEEAVNNYSKIFCLRFPLLYTASFIITLVIDLLKGISEKQAKLVSDENRYLSLHDGLTGLLNRIGLEVTLEKQIELTHTSQACIAILDVDNFKMINDVYGHDGGDFLLKEFSRLFETYLVGINCRYGGDEFAFVTFDDTFDETDLERFKDKIASHVFLYKQYKINVTTSIGAVFVKENELKNIKNCFLNADKELYFVKNNGKNNIKFTKYLDKE